MLKQMEEVHTVFGSLEEMLAPDSLSSLLAQPVYQVACYPFKDNYGLSGSQLSWVITNAGRLVLKQMSMETDYIMISTDDHHCRSVTLWQYGLLDKLFPFLEHRIIACSHDHNGWAILMEDLSQGLFNGWFQPIPARQMIRFLDRLARLHATFWNDPQLKDPRFGICAPINKINLISPSNAADPKNQRKGLLPGWIFLGWEIMGELFEPDVYSGLCQFFENPQPLLAALDHLPYTLVHGDYRQSNLAYLKPNHYIAFDWQQATRTVMTVDLLWFAKEHNFSNELEMQRGMAYYRRRLESYLETHFDEREWQMMIFLGTILDAFTLCFSAYFSKHALEPEVRALTEKMVKKRNQPLRDALHSL